MVISAKFPGKCSKCGTEYEEGTKINWAPGKPVSCVICPEAAKDTKGAYITNMAKKIGPKTKTVAEVEIVQAPWETEADLGEVLAAMRGLGHPIKLVEAHTFTAPALVQVQIPAKAAAKAPAKPLTATTTAPKPTLALPTLAAAKPQAPAQVVTIKVRQWFAKENGTARVLDGVVERQTAKAIYFSGHTSVKPSICCAICGRELKNPKSRILGIGPDCAEKHFIPYPDLDDPTAEEIDLMKHGLEDRTFKGWIPKSQMEYVDTDEEAQAM